MVKVEVNPDKQFVNEIKAKIKENNGHCACAISFTDDNICTCEEFRKQIKQGKEGYCHCGLYKVVVE